MLVMIVYMTFVLYRRLLGAKKLSSQELCAYTGDFFIFNATSEPSMSFRS